MTRQERIYLLKNAISAIRMNLNDTYDDYLFNQSRIKESIDMYDEMVKLENMTDEEYTNIYN